MKLPSHESGQTSPRSLITREVDKPTKGIKQMTGASVHAGAISNKSQGTWQDIPWPRLRANVNRLRSRIVKAIQEGRWGKVKALQRLLTHSFSGKAIAVKQVTENKGKRTSGVDRQIWFHSQRRLSAISELKQRGYKAMPLKRIYIQKVNGGKRPLGIPTMRDRAMQALELLAPEPAAETTGDPNSYGFRKGRSTADAIEQCFCMLAKQNSPEWILEGDIKSCFDQINHAWLLENVPMNKILLHKWLKAGFIDERVRYETEVGTPQGGICSPVLANLTLDGMEKGLKQAFPKLSRKPAPKVHVIRYADDFIVTGANRELLEEKVIPWIKSFLAERGLELSEEKTKIMHIDAGVNFLGQNIRKYKGKLLIKPSKTSQISILSKVRNIIQQHKSARASEVTDVLNPIIRGWANYHRHVVSAKVFAYIDRSIFKSLWRWCLRRHPNKSKVWIKQKYFCNLGDRSWVFYGRSPEGITHYLCYAARVPIRRHLKVRGLANPHDIKWRRYFRARQKSTVKLSGNPRPGIGAL